MPWTIEARDDEWCVVKEGGEVEGCHASRGQALAQQKALYAQESKTASAEGNGAVKFEMSQAPMRIEVSSAVDEALVASLDAMTQRLLMTEETLGKVVELLGSMTASAQDERESFREALTAAVQAREAPVVTVNVPEQETPIVNVTVPESQVSITNPSPIVNVTLPSTRKTVTFERDPLTGSVSKAQVEEEVE